MLSVSNNSQGQLSTYCRIRRYVQSDFVAEIIYLHPGHQMPDVDDDEHWLLVEGSEDGRFFGSGWALNESGDGVFYVSLPESDVTLELALEAAKQWATKYHVPRIWVRASPN
jgi:hypothetical protein